jgi:hypothetical protein
VPALNGKRLSNHNPIQQLEANLSHALSKKLTKSIHMEGAKSFGQLDILPTDKNLISSKKGTS